MTICRRQKLWPLFGQCGYFLEPSAWPAVTYMCATDPSAPCCISRLFDMSIVPHIGQSLAMKPRRCQSGSNQPSDHSRSRRSADCRCTGSQACADALAQLLRSRAQLRDWSTSVRPCRTPHHDRSACAPNPSGRRRQPPVSNLAAMALLSSTDRCHAGTGPGCRTCRRARQAHQCGDSMSDCTAGDASMPCDRIVASALYLTCGLNYLAVAR